MKYILEFLRPLITLNYRNPYLVLICAAIMAVLSGYFASKLTVDTDLANLLPNNNPYVVALDKLRETVGGETSVSFVINSPDHNANVAFAEVLIPKVMGMYDGRTQNHFFNRYEYTKETEILKDYALYLASDTELDEITEYLENRIEDAKLEANPFFIDFDDFDDDEEYEDESLVRFQQMYNDLVPPEYPVNADSTVLVVQFFPTGSRSDLTFLEDMFLASDALIAEMKPQQYHQEMKVLAGGRLKRHLQELEFIISDVVTSFASGIASVILLVAFYFFLKKYINYRRGGRHDYTLLNHILRFPIPVLVIGIPLFISLLITFGITYFVIGVLNTMTSVLFVILFGLGIDYGIHFYARYLEKRSSGIEILPALHQTYESTGLAIMTSAVTTAVSLYILMIADFRGFSEFGFISGTGIVLAFLTMVFILPGVLVIFERWNFILFNDEVKPKSLKASPRYPFSKVIVIAGILIGVFVFWNRSDIRYNYNFSELEPEFEEFADFRALEGQVNQSSRRNPAYIVAESNEEVISILHSVRSKMYQDPNSTILDVEALQERFPYNQQEEHRKLERVSIIRDLLQDPFMVDQQDEDLDILRRASKVTEPLPIDDVLDYLINRFLTNEGEIGLFVMIYPAVGLSDGLNSIAFKNEIGTIETGDGKVHHASSTSIVAAEMLELMRTESPYMVAATFLIIFIIVNLAFRSFRWGLIAMLPLVVGLIWTFAILILFDLQLNFYNMVVLPAIIGIGNDNGVHLANRFREEGRNSMWRVLRSTGQHITIGSLTTMLGFAGLLLTSHPGLHSIGLLAVIGIGMTLISSLTFLPALVQWLEDKNVLNFDSE